jgi:hypothetical protein
MANTAVLRVYVDTGAGVAWRDWASGEILLLQKAGDFAYGVTGAITVNEYNGGTHLISAAHEEICTTAHPANLEFSTDTTHYKKDGGTETLMDSTHPATTDCFNLHVTCSPNAQLTAASVYIYGDTTADPPTGMTVYACKQGATSPAWTDIGGSGAALAFDTGGSAATHDRYFGLTCKPTANGSLTGTLYVSATVV